MSKLITVSGNTIPIFNVIRNISVPSLEIQVLESKLEGLALLDVLQQAEDLSTLTLNSDHDIFENQYINYTKLDSYGIQYNYVVHDAVAAIEAVYDDEGNVIAPAIPATPQIVDNLITATLLQKSDLECKVESNIQMVNAMSVAIAEIIGE